MSDQGGSTETGERGQIRMEDRTAFVVGAIAVVAGLSLAAWAAWTCDDAFISYRYADNLVRGRGLVYNAGEKVEGYTNLLWTLWIALGLAVGAPVEPWSNISGLLAGALVLVLLLAFHVELRRHLPVRPWTLPLGGIVAALHPDWNVYTTGGLETAAFTCAVFGGYFLLTSGIVNGRVRPVALGVVFGLASMLRPDGMLLAGVSGASLVVAGRRYWKAATWFGFVVGLFWCGTTAFRLAYYGDFFPNTYYAKSAYLSWHRQGLIYLWTYAHKYWPLLVAPVAVAGMLWRARRAPDGAGGPGEAWFRVHALVALAFVAAYAYYVVRVGGDFMYARLLVPLTPLLALLFELALYKLSLGRPIVYAELVVGTALLLRLTPRPVGETDWISGIADEPAVYNEDKVLKDQEKARTLAVMFRGLPIRMAFLGTEARLMYEADIPIAIESDTGLTDRKMARLELKARGRIGHEKRASAEYLIAERKAHFALAPWAPKVLLLDAAIPVTNIYFGPVKGWILHWDPEIMAELGRRGAAFSDFPSYLDRYIATMGSRSSESIAESYGKFRLFYFSHVSDPTREAPFRNRIGL